MCVCVDNPFILPQSTEILTSIGPQAYVCSKLNVMQITHPPRFPQWIK